MATERAIATGLGILAEAFPTRETTARTADVWMTLFAGVSDEAFNRAALRLCRDPARRFFPSSGEVFAAIADDAPPVDVVSVLHRIEQLGYYTPTLGWVYPTQERVRAELGDAISNAYIIAGREKLYAPEGSDGNTITRDIARTRFGQRLDEAQRQNPSVSILPPLPSLQQPPQVEAPRERAQRLLTPGDKTPLVDTVAKVVREIEREQVHV